MRPPGKGGGVRGQAPSEVVTQARGEPRRPGHIGATGFSEDLEKRKTLWGVTLR